MIFEAVSALLAAVSIVFSRLDRHHDAAVATPDLRAGLLQLDGLLEDWLVAAQATNTAASTWLPASGDELARKLGAQSVLAIEVLKAVQSPLSDALVNRDTAPLRRLFEIYAPAESTHVAEWAKSRYDLVNRMLQDLARARQTQAPAQAKPWEAQLRESYDDLVQAQRQLREFIRSSFPLPD
jgi:hypothetical protein